MKKPILTITPKVAVKKPTLIISPKPPARGIRVNPANLVMKPSKKIV